MASVTSRAPLLAERHRTIVSYRLGPASNLLALRRESLSSSPSPHPLTGAQAFIISAGSLTDHPPARAGSTSFFCRQPCPCRSAHVFVMFVFLTHLAHAVLKRLEVVVVHAHERLRGALLGLLVLQVPHAVLGREPLLRHADLGQEADLKAAHVEEQVGVVLGVHRAEAVVPLQRRHRARQPVLHLKRETERTIRVSKVSSAPSPLLAQEDP
eukprot:7265556-Pyramimonas_sp.AAC.1